MRIAICLSGHMRTYQMCWPSWQDVFLPYLGVDKGNQVDFFIATAPAMGLGDRRDKRASKTKTSVCADIIQELYKPVQFAVSKGTTHDPAAYAKNVSPFVRDINHVFQMYERIKAADQMRQDHEAVVKRPYDLVIRARPDLFFTEIKDPWDGIQPGQVIAPTKDHHRGFNDQLFMADSETMKGVADCYARINAYHNAGCLFHPETLLAYHLKQLKVKTRLVPIEYTLMREVAPSAHQQPEDMLRVLCPGGIGLLTDAQLDVLAGYTESLMERSDKASIPPPFSPQECLTEEEVAFFDQTDEQALSSISGAAPSPDDTAEYAAYRQRVLVAFARQKQETLRWYYESARLLGPRDNTPAFKRVARLVELSPWMGYR